MRTRDIFVVSGHSAIWGASLIFMQVATPYFGTFATIWMRVTITASVLLIWIVKRGKSIRIKEAWKKMMVLGTCNTVVPFVLIAIATTVLPVSITAVIIATTPLFTTIMMALILKEPLKRNHFFALAMGVVGMFVLLKWSYISYTSEVILAVFMVWGALVSYGFSGVYVKKKLSGYDGEFLAYGQQLGAAILLFPMVLIQPPNTWHAPIEVWLSVIVLGVFCTEVAYSFCFSLISRREPIKTSSAVFLVPFFGMIWGAVFLNEVISLGIFSGFILIVISLMLLFEVQILQVKGKERLG